MTTTGMALPCWPSLARETGISVAVMHASLISPMIRRMPVRLGAVLLALS
jgi:hypothetical protein